MRRRRKRTSIAKAFMASLAIACCISWATNTPTDVNAATIQTDNSIVHTVAPGETLWEIAGPIADKAGMDVREMVYQIRVNNGISGNEDIRPGQKIVLRF